jgi:hypothetical protein
MPLFRKKEKVPEIIDYVWISREAKLMGLLQFHREQPEKRLVAWSEQTKTQVQEFFTQQTGQSPEILRATKMLPSRMEGQSFLFLEHHLFYSKEIQLLRSWNVQKVLFLNAIDDPVFHSIDSDRILHLLKTMGIKEDEYLQHRMITASIQRAQKSGEKKGTIDIPEELEDWFGSFGYH